MTPEPSARSRIKSALRLGVTPMLLALVGLPLIVVGSLIYRDVRDADNQRSTVQEIVPVANRRLEAIQLRAALSDERTWSIASLGVEQAQVDPDLILEFLGVDIVQKYAEAQATTDALTGEWPLVQSTLADARTNRTSSLDIAAAYLAAMEHVEEAGRTAAQELKELAIAVPEGEDLLRALQVSEAAADAQLAVNGQFVSSISSQFVESTGTPQVELQALVEYRRAYDLANDEIDRAISPGALAERLSLIREAPAEQALLRSVDAQISSALSSGLNPEEGEVFTAVLDDLPRLQAFLLSAETSNAAWVELTGLAGQQLIDTAEAREGATSSQIARSRELVMAIGLIALLATVFVALLFSRSLRRLARGAQSLRDGETAPFEATGPREVYLAGVALSEATSNFHLVRRQASLLAEGQLTHSDLELTAPGQLGATLKRVIDTLSQSLHDRERAQEDVRWQASHDGLTGLLNRSAAMEHIADLTARGNDSFAVLVVDLDGFKAINDSHGHPAGDEVLTAVSRRLRRHCRDTDEVFRLGGDEFVVLIAGSGVATVAPRIARRTVSAINETIELTNGALVRVSACIGIALSDEESSVTALLKNADLAVYEAKAAGRSEVVMCTPELLAESHRAAALSADIIEAIETDQLRLEYQPIVDVSGRISAVEALVRWDHPDHGTIMPEHFIPIAERSDLIVAIDRWVIRAAAEQLADWARDRRLRDLVIAVNVSTRHLNAQSAVQDILGPLRELSVDPARLSVEITETALVQDTEEARTTLEALRAAGIRIAVDDFGTGHSSITQLRVLPIDIIKIDRSFTAQVTNPGSFDAALIQLIIDTAHLLGAEIVTEGVESVEQADAAVRMGTDALQGWFFSASIRAEEVLGLLTDHQTAASRLMRRN